MNDGTPETFSSEGSLRIGITSPGAAFCAARNEDMPLAAVEQAKRSGGEAAGQQAPQNLRVVASTSASLAEEAPPVGALGVERSKLDAACRDVGALRRADR